ncbi:MAG TPA: CRISPR system precrRNA processing endoribonuclease RAMP protein Cas6 [Geobacteraceae bacterium]|nr:CRISPR system precrRNA processing endoribonuclease RAMP protein Cas6 [Geobacteraceae bacterium]
MDIVFAKLIFTLALADDITDRYALFRTRNDFMSAFRKIACLRNNECGNCPQRNVCSYQLTFSQTVSDDGSAAKRHQKPPLPFVFDFPVLPAAPNRGKEIEIGLVLAGTAINHVQDYIAATLLMFDPSPTDSKVAGIVTMAESATVTGCRNRIMEKSGAVALDGISTISLRDIAETQDLNPGRIRLTITTPMRLLHDGNPVGQLTFPLFIRPLLRRISSLAYYYYGGGLEVDYKWLSSLSESIVTAEYGFHADAWLEENRGERFHGLAGTGVFEGAISDFHFFLLLGEYFHVGKGASFGLGRYRIDRDF